VLEESMMCSDCGKAEVVAKRKNHRYLECGLDSVILEGVIVSECSACGMQFVEIPAMGQLHRVIAESLVERSEALLPAEIQFLRKSLGWSGVDFAQFMHVDEATVRRWERTDKPQPMGPQAELLLRMAVRHDLKILDYDLAGISQLSLKRSTKAPHMTLKRREERWVDGAAA
jgi:putative zinc finger/helix-turn-helix YgiT family protein